MSQQRYLDIIQYYFHEPIHSVKEDDHGWDHYVLHINGQWVFRFPRRKETAQKLKREKRLLDKLKQQLAEIQIPEYNLIFDKQETPVCVYYKRIFGDPLSNIETFRQDQKEAAANRIGYFLSALHGINLNQVKKFGFTSEQTNHFWETIQKKLRQKVFPVLNSRERNQIDQTFDFLFHHLLQKGLRETLIHGDFSSDHILFDGGRVSGVIDFGDTAIGDPAYDFGGLYWSYGSDFAKRALNHYQLEVDQGQLFSRVSAFYGKQAVFHQMIYAVEQKDEGLFKTAQKAFHERFM